MELLFGTNVREYGQHIGRVAGFEIDPATKRVGKLIFSTDGHLGNHSLSRPFSSALAEAGVVEIHPYSPSEAAPPREAVLLSHATRIIRGGREVGRLSGIDATPGTGELQGIVGRRSWWTRRFTIEAAALDVSTPGEIRTGTRATRAA